MTTIAVNGRSMAGDGITTCNGHILAYPQKVNRAPDGSLFGATGLTTQCEKFRQWMMSDPQPDFPSFDEDFCALILRPNGKVYWIDKHNAYIEYAMPAAIGSGSEYAIGAMMAGRTPKQAVEIAAMRDRSTAGDITELKLEEDNG